MFVSGTKVQNMPALTNKQAALVYFHVICLEGCHLKVCTENKGETSLFARVG